MQIKLTEENERLLSEVYKVSARRAGEFKLPPPSATQIVNGLISSYAKAYLLKFSVPETPERNE